MIIEGASGVIVVRPETRDLDLNLVRDLDVTPAGAVVVRGDGGWDPAQLRVTFRVASTVNDDAVPELTAVLATLRTAHSVTEGARTTYVQPAVIRQRLRGTWWLVTATFLPRALDGVRGTGEAVTYLGEVVTHQGVPVTFEVA